MAAAQLDNPIKNQTTYWTKYLLINNQPYDGELHHFLGIKKNKGYLGDEHLLRTVLCGKRERN